jgi:hypothetical protein
MTMPTSFSDAELEAVMSAARLLPPQRRDAFVRLFVASLERCCAEDPVGEAIVKAQRAMAAAA